MDKLISRERGSSTVEATLSLTVFILAIMFVYAQIKIVIGENIMQNAVNCMAKETASYVYILDKLGMILDHSDDDNKNINTLIGDGKGAVDDVVDFISDLSGDEGSQDDNMASALRDFVEEMKNNGNTIVNDLNSINKDDLKNLVENGGENVVKRLTNTLLSNYYDKRLDKYLPMEREKFCNYFNIEVPADGGAFSFDNSRVFPTIDCDSVMVAVTYETKPMIKFIPLKRKICKYAYTGAWVSSNTNHLKEGGT